MPSRSAPMGIGLPRQVRNRPRGSGTWRLAGSWQRLSDIPVPSRRLRSVPMAHSLATGGQDGTLRLWDAVTGKERTRATPHDEAIITVRFSPDGKLLATATRSLGPYLWCAITRKPVVLEKNARSAMVVSIAFSPDGDLLAAAHDDGRVVCWNTATGQPLPDCTRARRGGDIAGIPSRWQDHPDRLSSTARRGSGSCNGAICAREFHLPAEVRLVAFHPAGSVIATACGNGSARLWDPD